MSSVIPRTRIECPGLVKIPPAGPKHPAMTIAAGTRLGPHEIIAPVGTGGIGEAIERPTRGWDGMSRSKFSHLLTLIIENDYSALSRRPVRRVRSIIQIFSHSTISASY